MSTNQSSQSLIMIKPRHFGFNPAAAETNVLGHNLHHKNASRLARYEFDNLVDILRQNDIDVLVFNDTDEPKKPDAVFSNNWLSTWPNGDIYLYPIQPISRRPERRIDIVNELKTDFKIRRINDLSNHETENRYLESTGAVVFDHINKVGFAAISARCDEGLFKHHMGQLGYEAIVFNAVDEQNMPIYHTNVLMAINTSSAVICLDSIKDSDEKAFVLEHLGSRQIINISLSQMRNFAGNVLEIQSKKGDRFIAMSKSAFDAFTPSQKRALQNDGSKLLPAEIPTIEQVGGGSVRCMLTQNFLPKH